MDGIVVSLDVVYMAPKEEPAWQPRHRHPDMMQGKLLLFTHAPLAVEQVAVPDTQAAMDHSGQDTALQEHYEPDHEEKDDLHQPEEQIDPGEQQQVPARHHQDKDIQGNEQLTPKIKGRRLLPVHMAEGMGEDKKPGGGMQPSA